MSAGTALAVLALWGLVMFVTGNHAGVTFGTSVDPDAVTVEGATTRFRPGDSFAWVADLAQEAGTTSLTISLAQLMPDGSESLVVGADVPVGDPLWQTISPGTTTLPPCVEPGTYHLRVSRNENVLAEGSFTIEVDAIPVAASTAVGEVTAWIPLRGFARTLTHDDPSLEARLPTCVRGALLELGSSSFARIEEDSATSNQVIASTADFLGVPRSQVTQALALPRYEGTDALFLGLQAQEYRGATEPAIRAAIADVLGHPVTIGDQTVYDAGPADESQLHTYLYLSGDTIFFIWAVDTAWVTAALESLPGIR